MSDDKLETGCLFGAIAIWGVGVLLSLTLTVVIIWAIISVVSGISDNCYNELGTAVACP